MARLYFESLTDRTSPKAIQNALKDIPKGAIALPLVYDNIMARIKNQPPYSCNQAIMVLSGLLFAKRPLKTTVSTCPSY